MSASSFARIVLLSLGVAALPVEKIVRRESVQLGASGEFVEVSKAARRRTDYCNWDFPLGVEGTDTCAEGSVPLTKKEDCIEAAVQAGLQYTTVQDVVESYEWHRPKGCFMEPCPEATTAGQAKAGNGDGPCYRWNNREPSPDNITQGRPVCSRPRVKLGTINATTKEVECGVGYQSVMEEDLCLTDGKCLGDSDAKNDLVNNDDANKYNLYPLYCFLEQGTADSRGEHAWKTDSTSTAAPSSFVEGEQSPYPKVEYNAPLPNVNALPSNPVGHPVCNVTQITWFDKEGIYVQLPGCVRDAHNECVTLPMNPRTGW